MKSTIIVIAFIVVTACKQNAKHESNANTANVKFESALSSATVVVKQDDSLLSIHARSGSKKLSCCVAPPSRFKVRVEKK